MCSPDSHTYCRIAFGGSVLDSNRSLFNELLSTEANGTFKPDPRAYELGMMRLHLRKDEIARCPELVKT